MPTLVERKKIISKIVKFIKREILQQFLNVLSESYQVMFSTHTETKI